MKLAGFGEGQLIDDNYVSPLWLPSNGNKSRSFFKNEISLQEKEENG